MLTLHGYLRHAQRRTGSCLHYLLIHVCAITHVGGVLGNRRTPPDAGSYQALPCSPLQMPSTSLGERKLLTSHPTAAQFCGTVLRHRTCHDSLTLS
jgi:hypothetical protein